LRQVAKTGDGCKRRPPKRETEGSGLLKTGRSIGGVLVVTPQDPSCRRELGWSESGRGKRPVPLSRGESLAKMSDGPDVAGVLRGKMVNM